MLSNNWKLEGTKMRIGFDTGFFIELLRRNSRTLSVWSRLETEDIEGIVSCLTLFELERLSLKGAIRGWPRFGEALENACHVIWINREILSMASRFSHGLGIPAIDSIILACLLNEDVECIYTTDKHFETYHNKKIKVINIRA